MRAAFKAAAGGKQVLVLVLCILGGIGTASIPSGRVAAGGGGLVSCWGGS